MKWLLAVCLSISGCGPSAILWVGLGPGIKLHTDMACLAEVLSSKEGGMAEVDGEHPRGHKSPTGQSRAGGAWQRKSQKGGPHLPALTLLWGGLAQLGMLPARKPVDPRI